MTSPVTMPMQTALNRALAAVAVLAIIASLLAVLTTGTLLLRDYARQNLELIGRQAAYTVEVAVVFNDRRAIEDALQPLIANEELSAVTVRDAEGVTLYSHTCGATCTTSNSLGQWLRPPPVTVPIHTTGSQIGSITVERPTHGIGTLLIASLMGAALALALAFAATRLVGRRLQKQIIVPLQQIAEAAHGVRNERSFARRAPRATISEVDGLSKDFNALLDELQDWQQQVAQAHQTLVQRANYDPLSGLSNRASFIEHVRDTIRASQRTGDRFAILYMDGDGFKGVNDRHGHAAGDAAIAQIAARIEPLLRVGDVASRIGGDEFAVLIHHLDEEADAQAVADRICEAMQQPISVTDGAQMTIGLSIGIAIYPDHGTEVDALMSHADAAMYAVKTRTRPIDPSTQTRNF